MVGRKGGGIRRRIKDELGRLGLQAKAREVVAALARCGVVASEGLVNRVRFDLLKGTGAARGTSTRSGRPQTRRSPPKIPEKRPRRK